MADNNNNTNEAETTDGEGSAAALVGQKLQSADEVYVYKIPPLKTAGGHRAEDWNLAAPLKTCSLLVEQHGDVLLILFQFPQDPNDSSSPLALFAKCKIDLSQPAKNGKRLSMEYFVEDVVDSSRYFVVRIVDEKSGREARIGFGFRDREEATDFRESLNYYAKSIKRDAEAAEAIHHAEDLAANLSLQEGEKIHISLGGSGKSKSKSTITKTASAPDSASKSSGSSKPMLLKKPPPAPVLNKDISISFGGMDLDAAPHPKTEASSTAVLGDVSTTDDDDDEEFWQDFEDGKDKAAAATSES